VTGVARRAVPLFRAHDARLDADPGRVIGRLFLPGEGPSSGHSRAASIVARVLEMPAYSIRDLARRLVSDFTSRHHDVEQLFRSNARVVASRLSHGAILDPDRELVLGACFTAEYAVEGAALCNPSAFPHPDQTGLPSGALRVAVALREIGEGHISSIGFAEAVIAADGTWAFAHRDSPICSALVTDGWWSRGHLRAALDQGNSLTELASSLLRALPDEFDAAEVQRALVRLPRELLEHRDSASALESLRMMVNSAYRAEFPFSTRLSQRVLLPAAVEEEHGMEDARFVRFVDDDGSSDYRGTYTAYDGREIAPRLIRSADLRVFATHRLIGPAAQNKGMALFPRRVGGRYAALTRSGGEQMSLAFSADGLVWNESSLLHGPTQPWEVVQTGNCGSPLETEQGWLVLIHGVGPMRSYAIGALLLDLDDPSRILAMSDEPILQTDRSTRNGYVPNVVYSCGGVIHDGRLFLPYGIGDVRIAVASWAIDDLLRSLTPR
jgi:predicted GH43/DUF377 family glycosyl hydrolase